MMNNDSFQRNLEMGSKWEQEVGSYLADQGWDVEFYVSYDDDGNVVGQNLVVNGKRLAHPDFTIQIKKKNGLFKKMYVEVKSLSTFYNNWGRLDPRKFPRNIDYLTIEARKFDDYVQIHNITGLETRIIFVVAQYPNPWYWQEIDYLLETGRLAKYAYNNTETDLHYLWDHKLLKIMNSGM